MPIKKCYGIYLAYPPTVDLRKEGLGRHLAMFLKGASEIEDIRFLIVCPSWSKKALEDLFESESVPQAIEVIAPTDTPYILRLFEAMRARQNRQKKRKLPSYIRKLKALIKKNNDRLTSQVVEVRNVAALTKLLITVFLLMPVILLTTPIGLLLYAQRTFSKIKPKIKKSKLGFLLKKASSMLTSPKNYVWVAELYEKMHKQELQHIEKIIDKLTHVRCWYCPTAFWPEFNKIKAPRLMCVPDVLLSEQPTVFSSIGDARLLLQFKKIEESIYNGENYSTYSESVKWGTLVDKYGVPEDKITTIPHASNDLSQFIASSDYSGIKKEDIIQSYCEALLIQAMKKSSNISYASSFQNPNLKYLFYASQFRPNKNVITLLKAYEYLLRKRYLQHKLILTGTPNNYPIISRFIQNKNLSNDVLFLHGLSTKELAACYKLADLAVTATLSEGGFPFTYTEALSVGTPVVMSKIPVTEEVLTQQEELSRVMLFDPFCWKDCANKIEWALSNKDKLLKIQLNFYKRHSSRQWKNVVEDYISAMDKAAKHHRGEGVSYESK